MNETLPLECGLASKIKGYPILRPVGKSKLKKVKTLHIEKCEVFRSKILLKQHYQTIHQDAVACMMCTLIFDDMKHMRKHLARMHSDEYRKAHITSITTHCQDFQIDIDI